VSYNDETLSLISNGLDRIVFSSEKCNFVVKIEYSYICVDALAVMQSAREISIFTQFANSGVFPRVYGTDCHIDKDDDDRITIVSIVEKIKDCPEKKAEICWRTVYEYGRKFRVGDLHENNYFVTPEGQIKIIDAGMPL